MSTGIEALLLNVKPPADAPKSFAGRTYFYDSSFIVHFMLFYFFSFYLLMFTFFFFLEIPPVLQELVPLPEYNY